MANLKTAAVISSLAVLLLLFVIFSTQVSNRSQSPAATYATPTPPPSGLGGVGTSGSNVVITAASCSESNVITAIGEASGGDTVVIPAGTCIWNAQINITKGIHLMGSGQKYSELLRAKALSFMYLARFGLS